MKLEKLNPWNWFKHENQQAGGQLPVNRDADTGSLPSSPAQDTHPIWQLHREMNRLFDSAFRDFGFPSVPGRFDDWPEWSSSQFHPSLNVSSDEKNYEITLEAPGLSREEVTLEIRGDVLVVEGSKNQEKEEKDRHYYRVERRYGNFRRLLSLPEDAVTEQIKAKMTNGVLTITIPRKEIPGDEVKKVPIQP